MSITIDTRTVLLSCPVNNFDDHIRRVLDASTIDNQSAAEWLCSSTEHQRVACLLNILAKLRTVPSVEFPFINYVQKILRVREERVYFIVDVHILGKLQALVVDPKMPIYAEGFPKSDVHQELLDDIVKQGLGERQHYTLWSFRQEGRYSLQVVVAAPSVSSSTACIDCDIDLGNPLQDVEGIFIHLSELAHGVTDAMGLHDALSDRVQGPYLNYTVKV